jgi:hypothetical protein
MLEGRVSDYCHEHMTSAWLMRSREFPWRRVRAGDLESIELASRLGLSGVATRRHHFCGFALGRALLALRRSPRADTITSIAPRFAPMSVRSTHDLKTRGIKPVILPKSNRTKNSLYFKTICN